MSTDLASEVCPSSAAFFGFMGVASSMVFGSECKMVFSDENRRSIRGMGAFRCEGRGREGFANYLFVVAVGHLGRDVVRETSLAHCANASSRRSFGSLGQIPQDRRELLFREAPVVRSPADRPGCSQAGFAT